MRIFSKPDGVLDAFDGFSGLARQSVLKFDFSLYDVLDTDDVLSRDRKNYLKPMKDFMHTKDVIKFVKKHIEPLPAVPPYGERYRVAAKMTDETFLPCVVIESGSHTVDLAIKRFKDTQNSSDSFMGYRAIVTTFVIQGNTVNVYDLKEIIPSKFAIPLPRLQEIKGETSMSWTEFYAEMQDGTEFRFGTSFLTEFFEMPDGYVADDIAKIVPAIRIEKPRQERIYREKPFFTCYVEDL